MMETIKSHERLASLEAGQEFIKGQLVEINQKLDCVSDVKMYKRITWGTICLMTAGFVRGLFPS